MTTAPADEHNPFAPPPPDVPGAPKPPKAPNPWRWVPIGALVVLLGGLAAIAVHTGDVNDAAADAARPTLTLPSHLLNGQYTLTLNDSRERDRKVTRRDSLGYFSGMHIKSGYYRSGNSKERLGFVGFQGRIYDPEDVRVITAKHLAADNKTTFLVQPYDVVAPGDTLTCGVINDKSLGTPAPVPTGVCVWADTGTVGIVYDITGASVPARSVDLPDFASLVQAFRQELEPGRA